MMPFWDAIKNTQDAEEQDFGDPKGFALKGFLDVTVLTSPLVVARFEATGGSAHMARLEVITRFLLLSSMSGTRFEVHRRWI
jgi:hypothetical protein